MPGRIFGTAKCKQIFIDGWSKSFLLPNTEKRFSYGVPVSAQVLSIEYYFIQNHLSDPSSHMFYIYVKQKVQIMYTNFYDILYEV